jgi:hypothetical protein
MPMDDIMRTKTLLENWAFNNVRRWNLKLCWLPKICYITGKQLWGKYAYYGERWIHGPGDPILDYYWIDKHEFLIWHLKKK